MTRPDLLDLSNCALLYIHDDKRTALEAYRRYHKLSKALALQRNKAVKEKRAMEGVGK